MGGSSSSAADGMAGIDASSVGDFSTSGMSEADYTSALEGDSQYANMGGYDGAQHSYDRPPDFYDENGDPMYMGRVAGPSRRDKMMRAARQMMGGQGGGGDYSGGGADNSIGSYSPNEGVGKNQFFIERPWKIPDDHRDAVTKAWAKFGTSAISGAMGGMK
jgi:hypothetical protein